MLYVKAETNRPYKEYTACCRYQQLFLGKEVINFDINPISNITILFTRILRNI